MKLTPIQKQFEQAGLVRGGAVFLLPASDALHFVDVCEHHCVSILGVEGFKVFGEKIQPYQEHSFDLHGKNDNSHAIAREFIRKRLGTDLFFEIGTDESQ